MYLKFLSLQAEIFFQGPLFVMSLPMEKVKITLSGSDTNTQNGRNQPQHLCFSTMGKTLLNN